MTHNRSGGRLVAAVLISVVGVARADRPPRAPDHVDSASGKFTARLDLVNGRTAVYRKASTGPEKLWEMSGRHNLVFLSDDPQFLVSAYRGGDLLSIDHAADEEMLRFYQRGRLLRAVRLTEIIHHPEQLPRTASHLRWCVSMHFVDERRFVVETVEKEAYVFDASSGRTVGVTTVPALLE
jgi:hypothetical protein